MLFCSLVFLLRYVKINEISYKFTKEIILPDPAKNFLVNFREKNETIQFIDKIES